MVEAVEFKIGSVRVLLGSLHVSIHATPDGAALRLTVLNSNMRSCIILDLGPQAFDELEALLSRARAVVADRRLKTNVPGL